MNWQTYSCIPYAMDDMEQGRWWQRPFQNSPSQSNVKNVKVSNIPFAAYGMLLADKSIWRDAARDVCKFGPQHFPPNFAAMCLSWVFYKWIVLTCWVLLSLLNKFANSFKPYHTHRDLRNRQYLNQSIIGHYLIKLDLISDGSYLVSEFQRNENIDFENNETWNDPVKGLFD